MSQVLFNQLAYVGKLEASGFDNRQARGAAEALGDAFTEAVATKSDITELKNELKSDISELRGKLKGVEASLTTKIDRVDASLRSEMQIGFAQVDTKIAIAAASTISAITKNITIGFTLIGILIGITGLLLHLTK